MGDRPGLALTYGQLGSLFEARRDPAAALDWVVRCVSLFPEFPHPLTDPGPPLLARLTASLGMPALRASWQRCTGSGLPAHVENAVAEMIKQAKP